jgi:prepilin-type N-terminal cleavage/methylation domain-containing protein
MKRAFTLMELLVVIGIIAVLLAVGLPVTRQAREQANEAACMSNLRQLEMILKTYTSDNDGRFPNPSHLYHSQQSFANFWLRYHPDRCRWHDAQFGLDSSALTRDHPEFKGNLAPYLGNPQILLCKTGARANRERGCSNSGVCQPLGGPSGRTDPNIPVIPVVPQYTYTMNACLHMSTFAGVVKGAVKTQANDVIADRRTFREVQVRRESQVTRSPSEVFAFGEENSWPVNKTGAPRNTGAESPAAYNLSGYGFSIDDFHGYSFLTDDRPTVFTGAMGSSSLDIVPTYHYSRPAGQGLEILEAMDPVLAGDAFATYHRPRRGDLNTGHSYVSMLDGHVEKVTVADQLRASRREPSLNMPESRFGPGGNVRLAWPSEIPPLCGWENQ